MISAYLTTVIGGMWHHVGEDCSRGDLTAPENSMGEVERSWTKSVVGSLRPTFNFLLILLILNFNTKVRGKCMLHNYVDMYM